jgi:hypothetical protein
MTLTLLTILKKAMQSGDVVHEFDYWLSTYADDFVLTPEELGRCWQYLSEFAEEGAKDLFIVLGEIMYREAVLRNLWKADREFWRKLIEYEEDEILQKTMLEHFLANKRQNYVSECRKRVQSIANAIGLMMGNFMNPPEEPWVSLNERFGTIRWKFFAALDRAKEVLDEERGISAA